MTDQTSPIVKKIDASDSLLSDYTYENFLATSSSNDPVFGDYLLHQDSYEDGQVLTYYEDLDELIHTSDQSDPAPSSSVPDSVASSISAADDIQTTVSDNDLAGDHQVHSDLDRQLDESTSANPNHQDEEPYDHGSVSGPQHDSDLPSPLQDYSQPPNLGNSGPDDSDNLEVANSQEEAQDTNEFGSRSGPPLDPALDSGPEHPAHQEVANSQEEAQDTNAFGSRTGPRLDPRGLGASDPGHPAHQEEAPQDSGPLRDLGFLSPSHDTSHHLGLGDSGPILPEHRKDGHNDNRSVSGSRQDLSTNNSEALHSSPILANILLSPIEIEWFVASGGYQARLTARLLRTDQLCTEDNWFFKNKPNVKENTQTIIGKEMSLIVLHVDVSSIGEYNYTCRGYSVKTQLNFPGNLI